MALIYGNIIFVSKKLFQEMKDCRLCEKYLPLGPRPVFRLSTKAKIFIVGQAPGTKVHASGVPWDAAFLCSAASFAA